MEISDVKSPNIVYHVKVEAHSSIDRIGRLVEKDYLYSDIFFTHKEAYEEGLSRLIEKLGRLYELSEYRTGLTMEDFINDRQAWYEFTVMEIDLEAAKTYDYRAAKPNSGFRLANRPPYLEYSYSHSGELLECNYVYCFADFNEVGNSGTMSSLKYRPGDELPGAGRKFKPGDLVRLVRPCFSHEYRSLFDTEQIFVVMETPKRDKEGLLISNTYYIETVSEYGDYFWNFNFNNYANDIHESELQPYSGELPEGSPLLFLQRLARGGFGDRRKQADIVAKLESGEISFRDSVMRKDIPELNDGVFAGEEKEK